MWSAIFPMKPDLRAVAANSPFVRRADLWPCIDGVKLSDVRSEPRADPASAQFG